MYVTPTPAWRIIADAQRTVVQGAHRWEAENLNGWAIFNNGRDLPRTYRIGDLDTIPIYELREMGIAYVGTIAEHSGFLLVADMGEIQDAPFINLFQFLGVLSSGSITATQTANAVTAAGGIFTAAMVGATIIYSDGSSTVITVFTDSSHVTVGTALTVAAGKTFEVRVVAVQAGALPSGIDTGTMASGNATVTMTGSGIFLAGHVGRWVWFRNGWHSKISAGGYISATSVTLEAAPTFNITAEPFFIVNDMTDYIVTAAGDLFTYDMVGLQIMWPDGRIRTITEYVDAKHVKVDMYVSVASGIAVIENPATYAVYEKDQYVNRIGYKFGWSMPGMPRRWGSMKPGSITAGTRELALKFPMKSLEVDQQISISGAGISGGAHTTTIVRIYGLNTHFTVTTAANSTAVDQFVMRADAVGTVSGAAELQDDGSRILRAKACRGELVIYKETGIFLGQYLGQIDQPWAFKKLVIPESYSLFYPWSLIEVEGKFHFYAGRNAFFQFNMTVMAPEQVEHAKLCDDLFFTPVHMTDKEYIFAANNWLTKEVMLFFPSDWPDKGLCYDYELGTVATTTIDMTAAGMVRRPFGSDNWFAMGNSEGVLMLYGKLDQPWGPWGGKRDIFYRRGGGASLYDPYYPIYGAIDDYDSVLRSGMSDLGDPGNEHRLLGHTLILASQEQDLAALQVLVDFFGSRNPAEKPTSLGQQLLILPKQENLIQTYFQANCIQDMITVHGPVPCRISRRLWEVDGIKSKGFIRRLT